MRIRVAAVLLLASICVAAGAGTNQPVAASKEPVIENGFVGCPEFDTRSGKLRAGTAFLAKVQGKAAPLLITAQHIFGTAGGLKTDVPREQMAEFSKRVTLLDLVKGKRYTTQIDYIATPDTMDIAAFHTTLGSTVKAHPFAKENPKNGDIIWLVASLGNHTEKQILHRGTVVDVWTNEIKCKFDDGNLVTRGASGAPYVNAQGEIVGLHTGSFKNPGNIAGAVLPVETITNAINALLSGDAARRSAQNK